MSDADTLDKEKEELTVWSSPPQQEYTNVLRWLPMIVDPMDMHLVHEPLMSEMELKENLICATIPQCIFTLIVMKALYTKTTAAYQVENDWNEKRNSLSDKAMIRFLKEQWKEWKPQPHHELFLQDVIALAVKVPPISGPGVEFWTKESAAYSVRRMDCNVYIKRALDAYRYAAQKVLYIENVGEPRISRWYCLDVRQPGCRACGAQKAMPCSGCKVAHYCDVVCQRADWPIHKKYCKSICRLSEK